MLKDNQARQPQQDITHTTKAAADSLSGAHGQTTALYRIEPFLTAQPYPRRETVEVRQHFAGKVGGFAVAHNDARMPNLPYSRAFVIDSVFIPGQGGAPLLIRHDYGFWPMVQVIDFTGLDRAKTGIYIKHVNLYELELHAEGIGIETGTIFIR